MTAAVPVFFFSFFLRWDRSVLASVHARLDISISFVCREARWKNRWASWP
ncbi:predicted protein [Plenodomus lingam JN3]|uniref:Predicted protein n=1 Tax=Leptosphaeria maculans (strain JN3 / isolate v23.1.3 / race Av1-4-5-6-7-8) TaxID=985895 RepID=E5AE75_LEPMJ|nr:predicted protein [Plenodomus lingam JN3]CBY01514.1 predicted protein [Plenodomus lingam JN3]